MAPRPMAGSDKPRMAAILPSPLARPLPYKRPGCPGVTLSEALLTLSNCGRPNRDPAQNPAGQTVTLSNPGRPNRDPAHGQTVTLSEVGRVTV